MKKIALILILPLMVISCSSVKKTLGMEKSSPDEFAVIDRAPLTVPPNFDLMPPQPGAPNLQDSNTNSVAKGLVLGSQVEVPRSASASEQSLLSRANASRDNGTIRQQLANPEEETTESSVAQKLGIVDADSGNALNPEQEAKRLRDSKVKTIPVPVTKTNAQ